MLKKIKLKNYPKKFLYIISVILSLLIIIGMIFGIRNLQENILKKEKEEIKEISYKVYKLEGKKASILITFNSELGIDKIYYDDQILSCKGKNKVGIDYNVEDKNSYQFLVEYSNNTSKELIIDFEIPRIQGVYSLNNGIYANEPDISTGFIPEKTRFLYLDKNGNLVPGNWIIGEKPNNWYDYKNKTWANIYVEDEGLETYLVWIPRYCYKIAENERTDIKFINVYDEYIDGETGEKLVWEDLEAQGYKIPEAFYWSSQYGGDYYNDNSSVIIPGYWMTKYQLGEIDKYTIDYSLIVNRNSVEVKNLKLNTSETVSKYVFALNGVVRDIISESLTEYIFENVESGNKIINVTALNSNGEIIGSMTKEIKITEPNRPDVSAFDKDTTFYVYWDENENEHNEIPISKEPPEEWYDYAAASWANIVTRNDGLETYYVWIPRYSYRLNQLSQRTYVKFLEGTSGEEDENYKIPEAFTFDGQELTGYWITKYQLTQEESEKLIDAEMSAGSNLIRIKDITGTLINSAISNRTNIKYEYYLNGDNIHEGSDDKENYVIEGLNPNTIYTVNIIARNRDTDEYIGAVTKKITTNSANAPDISQFNNENTYYVYYEGDEERRVSIKESEPENWYDYSNRNWANIVTTANDTETYFVWIPRYEYKILSDRTNLNTSNRRVDVTFITTDITNDNCSNGYQVPEAFTFDGKELTGYWISKYQLN